MNNSEGRPILSGRLSNGGVFSASTGVCGKRKSRLGPRRPRQPALVIADSSATDLCLSFPAFQLGLPTYVAVLRKAGSPKRLCFESRAYVSVHRRTGPTHEGTPMVPGTLHLLLCKRALAGHPLTVRRQAPPRGRLVLNRRSPSGDRPRCRKQDSGTPGHRHRILLRQMCPPSRICI